MITTSTLFMLTLVSIIITFLIEVPVFYLLTKIFVRKVKFLDTLKTLLIFDALYFIFACICPKPIHYAWLYALTTIGIILISYLLFFISIHLTKLIDWKKGIILFILMFLIAAPITSYFVNKIMHMQMDSPFSRMSVVQALNLLESPPLSWRILSKIGVTVDSNLWLDHFMSIIYYSKW